MTIRLAKILTFSTTLFLTILLCACSTFPAPSIKPKESVELEKPDLSSINLLLPGESTDVSATNASAREMSNISVGLTLKDCTTHNRLPDYVIQKHLIYDKEYNEDFNSYSVSSEGAISEGYVFIEVTLTFSNRNSFDCILNLADLQLAQLSFDNHESLNPQAPVWISGREDAKTYYLPTLTANTSSNYVVGYIVSEKEVCRDNPSLIVKRDRVGLETKNLIAFNLAEFLVAE